MQNKDNETAVFAGGCFWCTEAVFASLKGVLSVIPGYSGGTVKDPTYDEVSNGKTGHAESIKIDYDPSTISYGELLTVFFYTHDPTTIDRQGSDVGPQYRSVIFYSTDEQRLVAGAFIKELIDSHAYDVPVVTELRPLEAFYDAEDYHQKYYEHHKDAMYCQLVIGPKMEKLNKRFHDLLK